MAHSLATHKLVNDKDKKNLSPQVTPQMQSLLHDFNDVFPHNFPEGLPPQRFVQHGIDVAQLRKAPSP